MSRQQHASEGGPRKRAVAYARTATRHQDESTASIRRQLAACRGLADERGADIQAVFTDHGASGRTLDRPALQKLISAVSSGPVGCVICADEARLSRDVDHFLELVSTFAGYNTQLWLAREGEVIALSRDEMGARSATE